MVQTHIIIDGRVENTIMATVAEAQEVFPAALCLDAVAGGQIGDLYDGSTGKFSAPPLSAGDLTFFKEILADQIDATVAEVYSRWFRFEAEYVARESAARKFIADGTSSPWVQSFAQPAGLTEADAAALIVQQADSLRLALESLGALRMRKYEVKAAETLESATACSNDIMARISAVAAGLQ